jgi:hypothetical protein
MARLRRPALLVPVLALAATLLTPSSASAETLRVRDARHDYWHDHRAEGYPPDQHPPDWGDPDLRRTVYRHAPGEVVVRLGMARLVRRDGGYWRVVVRFRTDEGLRRSAVLFKAQDAAATVDWSGRRACAIGSRIDYAGDVFVLRVPRRCLGDPREVELKSATRWWPTSDDVAYLDVAGTRGYEMRRWSAPVLRG